LISVFSSHAQSILVHLTDGSTQTYPLIDVRTVTLLENEMSLNLITGDTVSWNFSVIRYYEYFQPPLSIIESGPLVDTDVRVYPNPSSGPINIEFELSSTETLSIGLYDMKGSLIESVFQGQESAGMHSKQWNAASVGSGVYICKLTAGKFVYNKLIIVTD
jgi:hypothetical protein